MCPEIRELALDDLIFSPLHVRKDPGDIGDLTASITDYGILEPILVRPMGEGYQVIIGSRRVAAARQAGLTTIPAIVDEVTDVQATLFSLIENLQRKDLTLSERVEGYKALLDLNPTYTYSTLAQDIGVPHQKISQDFQAMEIHTKLLPYGISVASHLQPTDERRQRGEVLPEYHAVLLHQVMPYVDTADTGTGAGRDGALVLLARKIAPMSQIEARAYIASLKDESEYLDDPAGQQEGDAIILSAQQTDHRHGASQPGKTPATGEHDGGVLVCVYCQRAITLIHRGDGRHQVKRQVVHPENQMDLPSLNI
jgi:ParB/RepB/Spo0J family partition protein